MRLMRQASDRGLGRRWRGERGETLIEVMAAVMLTGLVVLGLVGAMSSAVLTTQRLSDIRNLDSALHRAVAEVEAATFNASGYTLAPRTDGIAVATTTTSITSRLQTVTVTATYVGLTRTQTVFKANR